MSHRTIQFWRTRNVLALVAILLCWFGWQHGRMILVAWSAVQLLFLVSMWCLGAYQVSRLDVRRRVANGAFEDEVVTVELFVANHGLLPVFWLEVADRFLPAEYSYKRILSSEPIERSQIVQLSYQGQCFKRRGRYDIGPVVIRLGDALGLFEHERIFARVDEFLVYPATIELSRLSLSGESPRQAARLVSEKHVGASPSFHGTREYRTGDEPRTIHWPTSARRGRVVVKEFDREVARHITIFLDLAARNLAGLGQKSTLEYSVKLAASLARRTLAGRGLVQLYGAGRRSLFVPPGAGQRQLLRILSALVDVRQDGEVPFGDLLAMRLRNLPRGSAAVMIFAGVGLSELQVAELLAICRARQVVPLSIVIDQGSFFKLRYPEEPASWSPTDLAASLAQGSTVYVVQAEGDIETYLERPWQPPLDASEFEEVA